MCIRDRGILMDKSTCSPFLQNGEQITSEVTFVPEAPSGSVEVLFVFDAKLIKTDTNVSRSLFPSKRKRKARKAVHSLRRSKKLPKRSRNLCFRR